MQRREAAPVGDELGVVVLAVDAGNLRPLRPAAFARASAAPLLGAALGEEALLLFFRERREVLHLRRHRDVGLVRRQLAHDVGAAVRGGEGERRLAFHVLLCVHVRALREQHLHGVVAAGRGGEHERRRAVRGRGVRIGAAVAARNQQRRVAADAGRRADVRAGVEEHFRELDVAFLRGPVQRRHPVGLRRVDVGAVLQQRANRVAVAVHRRVDDGGAADRRIRDDHRGQRQRGKGAQETDVDDRSSHGLTTPRDGLKAVPYITRTPRDGLKAVPYITYAGAGLQAGPRGSIPSRRSAPPERCSDRARRCCRRTSRDPYGRACAAS